MDFPEAGEIVVAEVKRVLNYGAFVELPEYGNMTGFIHISQVASRWVKNIRNHVRENQVRAATVLKVDRSKNQVDLSLTKVSAQQQREKLEEWKQSKRSKKLLEVLAKRKKKPVSLAVKEVAEPLIEEHGSLAEAFRQIASGGKEKAVGVKKEWLQELLKIVEENISPPRKTVEGILTLKSLESNGLETIKKALAEGKKQAKGVEVELYYKGGGSYVLKVSAEDYKHAEKEMESVREKVEEIMRAGKGSAEFSKKG